MGGKTGIVLSDEVEVDEDDDDDDDDEQSFGATVDSQMTEHSDEIERARESSSAPASPSLLRSLSDKIGLTTFGIDAKRPGGHRRKG